VGLLVENPGVWTAVQDRGRAGFRGWGVPAAGAFDLESHDLANALAGNAGDEATLEMTLVGGVYRAQTSLAIAIAGAPMATLIESSDASRRILRIPGSATLYPGDRLMIRGTPRGARTYLAVRGGWTTPIVLQSRSTEAPLKTDDLLTADPSTHGERRPVDWQMPDAEKAPMRVVNGPDSHRSVPLDGREFVVSAQCNRMGLRLEGSPVHADSAPERVSAPLDSGAVQLAGDRLIVLGPAGGTMGGYAHIAHVISADLSRLGQARPGSRIRFETVEISLARELDRQDRDRRRALCQRIACMANGRG
jgi:allophanate hydrolase subunit 2